MVRVSSEKCLFIVSSFETMCQTHNTRVDYEPYVIGNKFVDVIVQTTPSCLNYKKRLV